MHHHNSANDLYQHEGELRERERARDDDDC